MAHAPSLNRRRFLNRSLGAATAGFGVVLWGCGRSDVTRSRVAASEDSGLTEFYPHVKGIPSFKAESPVTPSQVDAGKPVTLVLKEASHQHTFTVTADDFAALKRGETPEIETVEAAGHSHTMILDPGSGA